MGAEDQAFVNVNVNVNNLLCRGGRQAGVQMQIHSPATAPQRGRISEQDQRVGPGRPGGPGRPLRGARNSADGAHYLGHGPVAERR